MFCNCLLFCLQFHLHACYVVIVKWNPILFPLIKIKIFSYFIALCRNVNINNNKKKIHKIQQEFNFPLKKLLFSFFLSIKKLFFLQLNTFSYIVINCRY